MFYKKAGIKNSMKQLTAIIERNEDAFFAYVREIDGIVAGGLQKLKIEN